MRNLPEHAYANAPDLHRDETKSELDAREQFMEGFAEATGLDRGTSYSTWCNHCTNREKAMQRVGVRFSAQGYQDSKEQQGYECGVEEGNDYKLGLELAEKANPFPKGRWS